MARPYSNDLRERVVAALASGRSCREVAVIFGVSVASVVKWSQRQRSTGTVAARQMGGYRKRLLEPHREVVLKRMLEDPHITVRQMVVELAALGIETCPTSVWRLARSGGLRFKKKSLRGRTRPAKDRVAAPAVEEIPGAA
jgi:transposase